MPVSKEIVRQEYRTEFVNNSPFGGNPTDFNENLAGAPLESQEITVELEIGWFAESSASDKWTIEGTQSSPTVKITRATGNFEDDSFYNGSVVSLSSTNVTQLNVGAITLRDSGKSIEFATPVGFFQQFPAGTSEDLRIDAIGADASNNLTALYYGFGLIQANETYNNRSKVSNTAQTYYFAGLSVGVSVDGKAQGTLNDWVTGRAECLKLAPIGIGLKQRFEIKHRFVITPFYLDGELVNLQNNTPTDLFQGDSLKYAFDVQFQKSISNPNQAITATFDQTLGSVGWFNQNFAGLDSDYRILSVSYQDADTSDDADGLLLLGRTQVTITIEKLSGAMLVNQRAILSVAYLANQDEYQNTETTLTDNFILDRLLHDEGTPISTSSIITSLDSSIDGSGNLVLVAVIEYSPAQRQRLTSNSNYLLAVLVGDRSLGNPNSDKVQLIADVNTYQQGAFIDGLATFSNLAYLTQPDDLGVDSGEATIAEAWNEDNLILQGQLDLDLAKQAVLTSLEFQLVAYNTVTDEFFRLDRYILPITALVVNGVQKISIDDSRGYDQLAKEQFNIVQVSTGGRVGDIQSYNFAIGQKIKWQDWIFNADADANAFFDNAKPNNNLNFKSSNYSGVSDYEIRIIPIANTTGIDELGRAGVGLDIGNSGNIRVQDYGVSDTAYTLADLKTLEPDTLADLAGQVLTNKPTLLESQFSTGSLATTSNVQIIHRLEESNAQGDVIQEFVANLQAVGNNLIGQTLLPQSLFEDGKAYNFTARLFNPFELLELVWDTQFDATANPYNITLPVIGDWYADGVLIASGTSSISYIGSELDGTLKQIRVLSADFSTSGQLTISGANAVNGVFDGRVLSGTSAIVMNGNSTITELITGGSIRKVDGGGVLSSLTRIDLSESVVDFAVGSTRIKITNAPSLTEFLQPISSSAPFAFGLNQTQLTTLDISNFEQTQLDLNNNTSLATLVLSTNPMVLAGGFALGLISSRISVFEYPNITVNGGVFFNGSILLSDFEIGGGDFTAINFSNTGSLSTLNFGTTGNIGDQTITVNFSNSGYNTATVDLVLAELDRIASVLSVAGSCVISITGNTAPTNGALNANVISLRAKLYIVNIDP